MTDKPVKASSVLPNPPRLLRALLSAVPTVGGPLDHLIFGRMDDIKKKNIRLAIKELQATVVRLEERSIDKDWFESDEALHVFMTLMQKVLYEHEQEKIKQLARIYPLFGIFDFVADPNKVNVLNILGQMTYFQINLLSTINKIPAQTKTIDTQGHLVERLERQVTAIMIKDIQDEVQVRFKDSIASEEVDLLMELDIIESLNVVSRVSSIVKKEFGSYRVGCELTALGKWLLRYLDGPE